jgi:hypothetical protein
MAEAGMTSIPLASSASTLLSALPASAAEAGLLAAEATSASAIGAGAGAGGAGVGAGIAAMAPLAFPLAVAPFAIQSLMKHFGINDPREAERLARAAQVGDAVTAAARGQMPIQDAIEAISPGTDNPSNMRRLAELKAAAEATRAMQETDQRRIDAENELRNAAAYQQTQNLNTISDIEQLVKERVLDSEAEGQVVAKIKADLMASAGLGGIGTSEIEKYKQKASQYSTAMTSGEGKWPVLAQAQKEYKQAGQLAPWMKYLPVNLQKEVMSSHVPIQEGGGPW